MSLQTLELEKLHLTLASEDLRLEVASTVEFRLQAGWHSSHDVDTFVKALKSGNIWASRGRRCRVDFEVSFDGKPPDESSRTNVLEPLGCQLRDAPLWSQLSLSTTFEIPCSQVADPATTFSLYVNYATPLAQMEPQVWLLGNMDIKTPEGVLCADFERLRIHMSFKSIPKLSGTTTKRFKPSPPESAIVEPMLLDDNHSQVNGALRTSFHDVVVELRDELSNSINKCFDGFQTAKLGDSPCLLLQSPLVLFHNTLPPQSQITLAEYETSNRETTEKMSRNDESFGEETRDKLRAWSAAHVGNLYPTNEEKVELMQKTRLKRSQINSWFSRERRRPRKNGQKAITEPRQSLIQENDSCHFSKPLAANDEKELLLKDSEDEMLFIDDTEEFEDEMLLSQMASTAPSLTSQTSTVSTISSTTSLKRFAIEESTESHEEQALQSCLPNAANKLAFFALYNLLAGPSNRARDLQGIRVRKSHFSTPLSVLVPSIFCHGFKEKMALNCKFLPTISSAIASSWVRNVQSVGLRSKLVELSRAKVSQYHDGDGVESSVERLVSVVQGRIWRMMQRTLIDYESARKIWGMKSADGRDANLLGRVSDNEDLLDEMQDTQPIEPAKTFEDFLGKDFIDEDEDTFDDLLDEFVEDGSDDGLLGYLEEQERRATEAETDEMLFGSNCGQRTCADETGGGFDDEILLFGDDIPEEDSMLI